MRSEEIVLRAEGIRKQFNGIEVLKGVDLEIRAGEVNALMGENGAGKSTIIKIISGVYEKDAGQIYIGGKAVEIKTRQDARRYGISVIYQELSLVPSLTVTENIFLGQEIMRRGLPDRRAMKNRVCALIDTYGFDLKENALVGSLGMAKRQMTEILKALSQDAKLLIMDEPTSALSAAETEKLFETMNGLTARGASVLYISHRLEEIYRMADRLTVMRDGSVVGILDKTEITPEKVTTMMIGRELKQTQKRSVRRSDSQCLEVKNLSYKKLLTDISFCAYGGEILGIGGLVGSGRTELIHCIYGSAKKSGGSITLRGKPLSGRVRRNIKNGFGLVPEDRRSEGFFAVLPVERNINIASYDFLSAFGAFVKRRQEIANAENAIDKYDVRPAMRNIPVENLSGGNQQKVVLGRWLSRDLNVLLLDEPTAGVDVGVKADLYSYIRELADNGAIVIMVSSDLEELTNVSDRILVVREGKIFAELTGGEATQTAVLLASSGIREAEGDAE
ncbi:MAG: sugar ABC transporter ATP-binding protein [Oscillospiraceae bacterium]|jgi:ribose transport system ATP-binding protein|nr:sugar ABC transporter ATP-binding protein [Oscillospiraceae bacterium]